MTVRKMFSNIEEIKKANARAGKFWFSKETIQFFAAQVNSRVYDDGKGGRVWVDSIQDLGRPGGPAPREYKIARFDTETYDVDRVDTGDTTFTTASAAEKYLTDNLI